MWQNGVAKAHWKFRKLVVPIITMVVMFKGWEVNIRNINEIHDSS